MTEKLFIDADVLLDILLNREPFVLDAVQLFAFIEAERFKAYTSPVVISNVYYMLSKLKDEKTARTAIGKLLCMIEVLPVDQKITKLALVSLMKDFEDAIQYYCAKNSDIPTLITRNIKHYKVDDMLIATPREFIKMLD